jgi:bis(5'-nucleosyl)-tetraphosphatase (symmetrical)
MSIYAIGDIQGCYAEFMALIEQIQFDPQQDQLWFTGDLVNRGPQSLAVLRYVKALGDTQHLVLGNHDLHLLALAYGARKSNPGDTLDEILNAADKIELIEWLRHRPLLHYDSSNHFVMTHAGLAPMWTLKQAIKLAYEVESVLQSDEPKHLLHSMYGDQPNCWHPQLAGMERLRSIINYFTRMRLCSADGALDLTYKGVLTNKPAHLIPWFEVANRANAKEKIIFGHWAALNGKTNTANVYALDTGCVWGNCLTAMRLSDEQRFTVPCGRS